MLFFLRKIKADHGSVEQCIIDLKLLSAKGIRRLKSNMIVDAAKQLDYSKALKERKRVII
jgi:hypothetical protein